MTLKFGDHIMLPWLGLFRALIHHHSELHILLEGKRQDKVEFRILFNERQTKLDSEGFLAENIKLALIFFFYAILLK